MHPPSTPQVERRTRETTLSIPPLYAVRTRRKTQQENPPPLLSASSSSISYLPPHLKLVVRRPLRRASVSSLASKGLLSGSMGPLSSPPLSLRNWLQTIKNQISTSRMYSPPHRRQALRVGYCLDEGASAPPPASPRKVSITRGLLFLLTPE